MKGLILAAGEGSRLSELNLKHKSFAVVHKKHVINFSLDLLSEIKCNNGAKLISEIIIVVGHNADAVMTSVGYDYNGIPVKYVYQAERKGIAHAILTAKEVLNDDFVLCLADEILLNSRMQSMVQFFFETQAACVCGCVLDAKDMSGKPISYILRHYGSKAIVEQVTEKPKEYFNEYRGVGECVFSKKTLELLEVLQPNPIRGEYEMGDYIQSICNMFPDKVFAYDLADAYVNINYAKDIDAANKLLE